MASTQTLPTIDLNRPAFMFNAAARALAAAGHCTSCKKSIAGDAFITELHRKEYGLSGMCPACQGNFFDTSAEEETPTKEEIKETTQVSPTKVGKISAIAGMFYQSYSGFTCSLHGTKHTFRSNWEDKHESWSCGVCKAEGWFRVRQYDAYGDEI